MTLTLQRNTSSIAISISALLALGMASSSFSIPHTIPFFEKVTLKEETTTPKIFMYKKSSWAKEAKDLFPGARDFTVEEAFIYEKSLAELFQQTGKNFFDL
jgi:hypothetical protein